MTDIADLKLIDYEYPVGSTGIVFVAALQGYLQADGVAVIRDHQIRWGWHRAASTLAFMGLVSGETFNFLRDSIPMTYATAMDLFEVGQPTIQAWESGALEVPVSVWLTLAQICGEVDRRPGTIYTPVHGMDFRPRRVRIFPEVPAEVTQPVVWPRPCPV